MSDPTVIATTRKQAIEKKCTECLYDPHEKGTWREQIEACTCPSCPLYPFRPTSYKTQRAKREEK